MSRLRNTCDCTAVNNDVYVAVYDLGAQRAKEEMRSLFNARTLRENAVAYALKSGQGDVIGLAKQIEQYIAGDATG